MAFREPANRLPRKIEYSEEHFNFLNDLKPWKKSQWSSSLGTPELNKIRKDIKDFIKEELETIQDNYCAFCGINLSKVYKVHREHIAPQYKHEHYIYEPENLVLSCCYCNDHKGTRLTVIEDTEDYQTTTFKIHHPHRDNYSDFLECDFNNKRQLIFSIIGNDREKTQATITCLGLNEPHLMTIRGGIIFQALYPVSEGENELMKEIISVNRKG